MSYQGVYGFPCVNDPNDFTPDAESSTPEEQSAHKLACETFGTPAHQPNKGCFTEVDDSGRLVRHVARTSWGLGVSNIRICDGCESSLTPSDGLLTCHDCGGHLDFCPKCWPQHTKECGGDA